MVACKGITKLFTVKSKMVQHCYSCNGIYNTYQLCNECNELVCKGCSENDLCNICIQVCENCDTKVPTKDLVTCTQCENDCCKECFDSEYCKECTSQFH